MAPRHQFRSGHPPRVGDPSSARAGVSATPHGHTPARPTRKRSGHCRHTHLLPATSRPAPYPTSWSPPVAAKRLPALRPNATPWVKRTERTKEALSTMVPGLGAAWPSHPQNPGCTENPRAWREQSRRALPGPGGSMALASCPHVGVCTCRLVAPWGRWNFCPSAHRVGELNSFGRGYVVV